MSENYKIKSNVEVEKDLTVTGDLNVNGTTTSVNSATLDVTDSNITVNDGGTQASADTNDAGLTVEMSDANDALIHYDSTSATKWKVGDTAATADIVDVSTAQGISGKTITSSTIDASLNTVSNVDLASQVTGTLPVANGGTGQTTQTGSFDALAPTTTKGDTIVHNGTDNIRVAVGTDGQALIADSTEASGVKWGAASGGAGVGGINYLTGDDFNFENTTGNWATYDDGASATPVDGTLGSPSTITIAQNTSTPQIGAGDLRISKSAADGQGEGTSVDLTAEEAFKSSVNKIEFYYKLSTPGDFVTGADSSLQVFLYDVTGAALVPLSNEDIEQSSGRFRATFVGTGSTSYRLIFHVTDTVATAWALDVDNVVVGPNDDVRGVPATDSRDYTPTLSAGWGTPTTNVATWWRVGDKLYAEGFFTMGTVAASVGTIGFPAGLNLDTGKIASTTAYTEKLGEANRLRTGGDAALTDDATVFAGVSVLTYDGTNTDRLQLAWSHGSNQYASQNISLAFATGDSVAWKLNGIPISGWSSDVSMASGSTFRMSNVLANGTQITTAAEPAKLGEYKVYTKSASSAGGTVDATAAPVTTADGLRIYAVNFATAGTAGSPNRWEIFIGQKKHYELRHWELAGKSGDSVAAAPWEAGNETAFYGLQTTYDDETGILIVDTMAQFGAGTTRHTGLKIPSDGGAWVTLNDHYFDIIVSDNPGQIGLEAPRSIIRISDLQGTGRGTTDTAIMRFDDAGNLHEDSGGAITQVTTAANGTVFTIQEPGVFYFGASANFSGTFVHVGISKNSSELATGIEGLTNVADRLMISRSGGAASADAHVSWTGPLSKGDKIRIHTETTASASTAAKWTVTATQVSK